MVKVYYSVKARGGVYACYDVSGDYLGVAAAKPAGAKGLQGARPQLAAAIKADAGKRGPGSLRVEEGLAAAQGDQARMSSRAVEQFARLGRGAS